MSFHYVTGEFASSEEEVAFLDHKQPLDQKRLAVGLTLWAPLFLIFGVTDAMVLKHGPGLLLACVTRAIVSLTALGCAYIGCTGKFSVRKIRLAAGVAEAVSVAGLLVIATLRPADFPWAAMALAIMTIVMYLYVPNAFSGVVALNLVASAALVALSLHVGRLSLSDTVTMTMLLLLANAFGAVALRRFNILSRTEYNAQSKLVRAAEVDHLTGCYNRRYLQETLIDVELTRARRTGQGITVIACDIDHFKRVNDEHGHAVGDDVIRMFAGLLKRATRSRFDSAVRCGGEEFLLILPGADLEAGARIAERLRASFAISVIPIEGTTAVVRATASFGVASSTFNSTDPEPFADLLREADNLLYEAKRAGRNCVRSGMSLASAPVAPAESVQD